MRKIFNILFFLSILIVFNVSLISCSSGLKTFDVKGYVLSEDGGVEGAVVSCDLGNVVTDEAGYYEFEGLTSGTTFYVSHSDYYFPISLKTAFNKSDNLNFNGLKYYTVSGKVVGSTSDNPITNAKVSANGVISCYTFSNNDGEFVLNNVVGRSTISIEKDGFEFETYLSTSSSNNQNITFDGKTKINILAKDEYSQSFSDYNILLNQKNILINSSNEIVENIPIGSIVKPYKENFKFFPESVTITQENQQVLFQVFEEYSYTSTILCGETPVENVEIYVNDELMAKSNSNGVFELKNLFGCNELSFIKEGYDFKAIQINSNFLPEVIESTKKLVVQVLDDNNKPIENVTVICNNQSFVSDNLGFVEIVNAKISDVLYIEKNGYLFDQIVVSKYNISNLYGYKLYDAKVVVLNEGKPLKGVELKVNNSVVSTDINGLAIFNSLFGTNLVEVKSSAYKIISKNMELSSTTNDLIIEVSDYYDFKLSFNNIENTRVYFDDVECVFENNSLIIEKLYGKHQLLIRNENYNDLIINVSKENCVINNPDFYYNVQGVVLTDKTPIADVIIKSNDMIVAQTDKNGLFIIENLINTANLSFEKEGFEFSNISVNSNSEIEIQGYYSVFGFVKVDKQNVPGVNIKLQKDKNIIYSSFTDKDGRFEFKNLNGLYSLYVSDDDQYNTYFIEKGYSGISSYGKYDFVNNSYKISGYVCSGELPVSKVKVTAGDYETYTDDNGRYQFTTLSDEVDLILSKDGYVFEGNARVNDSLSNTSVDFVAKYTVSGEIKSGDLVIKNVYVSLGDNKIYSEDGSYEFKNLLGENSIVVSKEGYSFETLNISSSGKFDINGTYSITGVVKTGEIFVENVSVVSTTGKSVKTNNDGVFYLSNLIGTENLIFNLENYNIQDVLVDSPADVEINCTYNILGYIKSNNQPLKDVQIIINSEKFCVSDENGYFEVKGLVGKNTVEYNLANYEFNKEEISQPFNKIIVPTYTVMGKILLNNKPFSNVEVSSKGIKTITNSEGCFELKGLSGSGTLVLIKEGYKFLGNFEYNASCNLSFTALYSISGVIKSGELKLSGAKVSYLDSYVVTNTFGEFKIENLSSEVSLTVSVNGYEYFGEELKFADSISNLEIQMGYRIIGKIQSSKSVENVDITLNYSGKTLSFKTEADGSFNFQNIYGNCEISFIKEGFKFETYYYSKNVENLIINPTIVYKITGTVKAGDYSISDAVVKAGSFGTFNVEKDGSFEINNLSGTIVVSAILSKTNCQSFTSNQITVSDNANLQLKFNINDYCYFMYEQGFQTLKDNTYETTMSGTVELSIGGTQQVRGSKKKGVDGNVLYEQMNYGKEILGIDPRMAIISYYDPAKPNKVYYKTSKEVSTSYVVSYGSTWNNLDYNSFKNTYGFDVQGFFCYVITQSTISNITNISKNSEGLSFKLVLNPTTSVVNYLKNMSSMSGQTPTGFKYVHLSLFFDSNGNVIKSICDEEYTIKKGVTVTAKGYITETYKITNGKTVIQKYV